MNMAMKYHHLNIEYEENEQENSSPYKAVMNICISIKHEYEYVVII